MNKHQYVESLFNTLGQLKKLIANQTQELREEKSGTIMQYSALKFLKQNTNSTVSDLAKHLKLSKSSTTQLIERIEKVGFVERIHDKSDRRIVRLSITLAGDKKIAELKKRFINKMATIFSNIPDEDLKELIRIHSNLVAALKKEGE